MSRVNWMARVLAIAALLVGVAFVQAPQARAQFGGDDYQLMNRQSLKCLDLSFDPLWWVVRRIKVFQTSDGAPVMQFQCASSSSSDQIWRLSFTSLSGPVRLANRLTGKCVDVANPSTANAASVVQSTCNGSTSQLWRAMFVKTMHLPYPASLLFPNGIPLFVLQNVNSSMCLDVASASTTDFAPLVQAHCTLADNQLWDLFNVTRNFHGL
jgi:pectate lyase